MVESSSPIGAKLAKEHYPEGLPAYAPVTIPKDHKAAKAIDWITRGLAYGLVAVLAAGIIASAIFAR